MTSQLFVRIVELRDGLVGFRQKIVEASKRCAGCAFLEELLKSAPPSIQLPNGNQDLPHERIKAQIDHFRSLLSQAAECKQIVLSDTNVPDRPTNQESQVETVSPSDQIDDVPDRPTNQESQVGKASASRQTDLVSTDQNSAVSKVKGVLKDSGAQTNLLMDGIEQIDTLVELIYENKIEAVRYSLEQLIKLSATELEREDVKARLQFAMDLMGIKDEMFDKLYEDMVLLGCSIEFLRRRWLESKQDEGGSASKSSTETTAQGSKADGTQIAQTDADKQADSAALEALHELCSDQQLKVEGLKTRVDSYKDIIAQLATLLAQSVNATREEFASEDGFTALLSNVQALQRTLERAGIRE